MKKSILKALSVMVFCLVMITIYTVASSAMVEVIDDKFIFGTEVAEKKDYNIVNGVTESYLVTMNDGGTHRVDNYVLEIDMSNSEIGILASYKDYMNGLAKKPEWGMQALRDQAVEVEDYYRNTVGEEDFEVVAGVNGDFFNMGNGAPTGTLIMNGITYNTNKNWPFFAILDDGTCVIGERGDKLPSNAMQVIGGPEVLIKNGVFTDAVNTSGYGEVAHPRTAIGIKENGNIVMLVSDGRMEPESCGQTFYQLAEAMLALGCVDALCLDGGGSASFISQRDGEDVLTLRNIPADGIERTVSTGLLIYTKKNTNKYENVSKWFNVDGKIGYYGADGVPVKGEQVIDGFTYHFDENGVLLSYAEVYIDGTLAKNRWSGTKYYVGEDGLPIKGTHKIGDNTFIFNEETGVLEKSSLTEKWYECGTSICYFDADGIPVKKTTRIGTTNYPFDENGKLTAFACVKDDGTLVNNQWVGKTYYLGANGLPRVGKFKIGDYTYTFGADGKLVKGHLVKEGNYTYYYIAGQKQRNWHLIDGKWHYFDRQTGFGMATGANSDKVSIDFDKTDGLYTVSTTDAMLLFKFDNNGGLIRGAWLETDYGKAYYWGNHERLTGWQTIEGSKYYFNNDTYAVTGKQLIDGVMYGFDADGKLKHTYAVSASAEPTCVQTGHITYVCDCGDVYVYTIDALGHDNNETLITTPTCSQTGLKELVCKVCGHEEDVVLEKTEHTYEDTVIAPTCTQQGYTHSVCSVCAYEQNSAYVDALGHDFAETVVTPPTCTQTGIKELVCNVCSHTENAVIEATGHSYEDTVIAPTCTAQGYTHSVCSACGDAHDSAYVDALGHDYTETVTPATCTQAGKKELVCSVCGHTESEVIAATGHSYEDTVIAPTCTEQGYTHSVCSACSDAHDSAYVDALGHDYTETVTPATCTQAGKKDLVCSVCGHTESEVIAATGHSYEDTVIAPTCTAQGYTHSVCSACGDAQDSAYVDALGHDYAETVTPATCIQAGKRDLVCSVCGHTESEVLAATGHNYEDTVIVPTCTEQGYTHSVCSACGDAHDSAYVDALGHDYTETVTPPTCTEKGYTTSVCSVCADTKTGSYTDATGHDYNEEVIEPTKENPGYTIFTCKVCGYSYNGNYVGALDHNYIPVVTPPTCTQDGYTTYTCDCGCGSTYIDNYVKASHSFEFVSEEKATCTQEGTREFVCSVCGQTETEVIEATGHNYENTVIAPTCTEQGYTLSVCSVCEDTKRANYVDATGHTEETIPGKAATCTENGLTEGKKCSVCDIVTVEQTEIEATGHNYGEWKITKDATCKEDGQEVRTCALCSHEETKAIAKTEHTLEHIVNASTCTVAGSEYDICTVCNETFNNVTYDLIAHTTETVPGKAATCTEKGLTEGKKCSVCGVMTVEQTEIEATGHKEDDWVVVKPAEIGVAGKEQKKCSVCQTILDEREIPALEEPAPEVLIGDVNGDNKITAADARLALRISARLDVPAGNQAITADYNKDKKITAADARLILRKSAKLDP